MAKLVLAQETSKTAVSTREISFFMRSILSLGIFAVADTGATYHYYMGDITFKRAEESTRAGKKIYDVEFSMNEPVKQEMFDYFEALKVLKEESVTVAG